MPSLATAKTEKSATFEVADPIKYISNVLEKRIRNLEKRKIKLDNYRSDVENGKELNEDQKMAVSKYGEVISCLDMTKDLAKIVSGTALDYARQLKKQAKKEQLERQQHEIQRLQEGFLYSYILSCFQNEDVRSDFLNGENGAVQLSSEQLSQLDQLFKVIGQKPPNEQADITSHCHVLAENHIFLVEGKNKEIVGTTYKTLKETLVKIKDSGYFSRPSEPVEESGSSSDEMPEDEPEKSNHIQEFTNSLHENEDIQPVSDAEYSTKEENLEEVELEDGDNETAPLQEVLEQQGSFNFLQESQIDLDAPHMDPAVVAVHQMAPAPSVNFVGNSYASSPPAEEIEKPLVNGTEPCETSIPQQAMNNIQMVSPRSVPPVLMSVQHGGQTDFDPSHPIPTQTFTNQSFAVMQNMMPQAYVPVTLHHAPLPTTIAVISAPPTGVHIPMPVSVPEMSDLSKSDNADPQINDEEGNAASDVEGHTNGLAEDKGKEGNGYGHFRGGYRGRGRGRGNNFFRGRGNYSNNRGGYQNNFYRDRNGYNDNYRRNNRGRGGSSGNNRGRGNYRVDGHQQRNNNYHQKQQQDRSQQEGTQQ